jgi:FMN phosphatase YigB (HAD superfamily)
VTVRYLLWDFGDTLADERWVLPCPDGVEDWTDAFRAAAASDLGARWSRGDADVEEFARHLSVVLAMPSAAVVAHIEACCTRVEWFDGVWAAARAATLPQALVTVNPDVFSRFVVANYRLDDVFPVIVTSWEAHTNDKTELCGIAMRRLGCAGRSETLLIDNIAANVESWRAAGGNAYHFQGEEAFLAVLDTGGWDALASVS